jgi:hypothetical protein
VKEALKRIETACGGTNSDPIEQLRPFARDIRARGIGRLF